VTESAAAALGLVLTALACWVLPALGMRMLAPSLASSDRLTTNYRGRSVFLGLGIVWVFWSLGILMLFQGLALLSPAAVQTIPYSLALGALPVLGCFVFGLIDDVFGTSAEKGLGGHLRALARGRLTTGGLKLIGIGLFSLYAAIGARGVYDFSSSRSPLESAFGVILATVVIAGSANLLNLLDLRPGRALKSYLALALLAWLLWATISPLSTNPWATNGAMSTISLVVAIVGPALAVWRFDLGEKGMLGDAGANPAGALVGFLFATALPIWGLAIAAAVVVAANLASERVSFSAVIEGNGLLSRLDSLGRQPDSEGDTVAD
jgi:UDP-GlcNAc:undecaprenyl-phosphate GlcNAc-1-phosphate transferase